MTAALEGARKTMYRSGGYGKQKIEPITVIKETTAFVTVLETDERGRTYENKTKRRGAYHAIHDGWDDAHTYLLTAAECKVVDARRALQRAQDEIGNIKGMKRPAEATHAQ